jgi:hypothetical protein
MGKPAELDERVARLHTHGDCEPFAVNATERGPPDLAEQARKQATGYVRITVVWRTPGKGSASKPCMRLNY